MRGSQWRWRVGEAESTNPTPSEHINVWNEAMPSTDAIGLSPEAQVLKDHAHLLGVYWDSLIANGVPYHLAETLCEEYSEEVLSSDGDGGESA
jgi:hypothetical protein